MVGNYGRCRAATEILPNRSDGKDFAETEM